MSECESVRGQWGGICPDCGQRLPARRPLQSWKSQHDRLWGQGFGAKSWTPAQRAAAAASSTFAGADRAGDDR